MVQIKASWFIFLQAIFLLLALGYIMPVFAQDPSTEITDQLQEIKTSINLNSSTIKNLEKEIAKLDGDRVKQSAALIAAAQRIKLAEIEADVIEENLSKLLEEETIIKARLDGTNEEISNILGALQRIGRTPAPALIVNAGDALNSARSAMLISQILPQLQEKANLVSSDLQSLEKIVKKAQNEEDLFSKRLETLAQERLRISSLLELREKELTIANEQLQEQEQNAKQLADEAKSLEKLLNALSTNTAQTSNQNISLSSIDPKAIEQAFTNVARTQPAIPFSKSKGYLEIPAAGVIIREFADDDNLGGKAKGISIITRAQAQVVAPSDGWVIYKGPYLNYGQIIIIDPGDGYTILLAGLDSVNVNIGQFIMRQEPIGLMGTRTIAQGVSTNAGQSRPTLYIELREQDIPINPSSWWKQQNRKTQSG